MSHGPFSGFEEATDRVGSGRPDRRIVGIWLLVCCALVFAMVVLGGVTRLTGSGLSMVDWRPVMGVLPPRGETQWRETFALYQQSPEFQKVNSHMDLKDFKGIFWLEYLHRLLGRTIGLVFLVPFLFFLVTGRIEKREWPKYMLMFVLGGLQGLLGWYMVKSGLINNPHVSQYRLTAHLIAAFVIYAFMFWVALDILVRERDRTRHRLYGVTVGLTGLIAVTIVSGGFVAGLKAGLAYNTFPLMGGKWIPDGLLVLEPAWRNLFDNLTTVQFDHRVLAVSTLLLSVGYWLFARAARLPTQARIAVRWLLAVVAIQVTLGITTLVLVVPTTLAVTHQATALILFTTGLFLCHSLHGTRP